MRKIKIAGEEFPLSFPAMAIVAIENALKAPIQSLMLQMSFFSMTKFSVLLWAGLLEANREITLEEVYELLDKEEDFTTLGDSVTAEFESGFASKFKNYNNEETKETKNTKNRKSPAA